MPLPPEIALDETSSSAGHPRTVTVPLSCGRKDAYCERCSHYRPRDRSVPTGAHCMEGPVLSHGPNGVVDGKEPNGWARLGPPDRRPKAGGHPRQALLHLGQVRQRAEEVPGALVLRKRARGEPGRNGQRRELSTASRARQQARRGPELRGAPGSPLGTYVAAARPRSEGVYPALLTRGPARRIRALVALRSLPPCRAPLLKRSPWCSWPARSCSPS